MGLEKSRYVYTPTRHEAAPQAGQQLMLGMNPPSHWSNNTVAKAYPQSKESFNPV